MFSLSERKQEASDRKLALEKASEKRIKRRSRRRNRNIDSKIGNRFDFMSFIEDISFDLDPLNEGDFEFPKKTQVIELPDDFDHQLPVVELVREEPKNIWVNPNPKPLDKKRRKVPSSEGTSLSKESRDSFISLFEGTDPSDYGKEGTKGGSRTTDVVRPKIKSLGVPETPLEEIASDSLRITLNRIVSRHKALKKASESDFPGFPSLAPEKKPVRQKLSFKLPEGQERLFPAPGKNETINGPIYEPVLVRVRNAKHFLDIEARNILVLDDLYLLKRRLIKVEERYFNLARRISGLIKRMEKSILDLRAKVDSFKLGNSKLFALEKSKAHSLFVSLKETCRLEIRNPREYMRGNQELFFESFTNKHKLFVESTKDHPLLLSEIIQTSIGPKYRTFDPYKYKGITNQIADSIMVENSPPWFKDVLNNNHLRIIYREVLHDQLRANGGSYLSHENTAEIVSRILGKIRVSSFEEYLEIEEDDDVFFEADEDQLENI